MLFGFLTEMDSGPTLDVFAVVIRNLPIVHKELIYMCLVSHAHISVCKHFKCKLQFVIYRGLVVSPGISHERRLRFYPSQVGFACYYKKKKKLQFVIYNHVHFQLIRVWSHAALLSILIINSWRKNAVRWDDTTRY